MENEDNIRQDGDATKTTTDEPAKASADEDIPQGGSKGGVKPRPRPRIVGAKIGPPKAGAKKSAAKKAGAAKKGAKKGKAKAAGTLVDVARAIGGGLGSAVARVSNLLPGGGSKKGSASKGGTARKAAAAAAKAASKAGAKKAGAKKQPAKKASAKSSKGRGK